jgi:hypothetical protein
MDEVADIVVGDTVALGDISHAVSGIVSSTAPGPIFTMTKKARTRESLSARP